MPADPVTEIEIEAYVDGQLDAARRMAVEDHLARHADLAARVMTDLRAKSALQVLFQADQALPSRITLAAGLLNKRLARRRRRLPVLMGLASAATVSALLLLPTTKDAVPSYVGEAVMSHRIGLIRASMASQIESPRLDAREIMRSTHIRVPILPSGWRITDVQLFPADAGPALQIMIRTAANQTVSIFAMRDANHSATAPVAVRRGSDAVAYWYRGGISYALTGAMTPEALDSAAEDLADNRLS